MDKENGVSEPSKANNTTPKWKNYNKKKPQVAKEAPKAPPKPQLDQQLANLVIADPRDPTKKTKQSKGRNTESFDPKSTLVRPNLRVQIGSSRHQHYNKPIKHDDVICVPELFGVEDDWSLYYKLVEEITLLQQDEVKGSEWISWHEGSHLIVRKPEQSPTFNQVIDKLCAYFQIERKSVGIRFNWYTDSTDWKPFHHDSA